MVVFNPHSIEMLHITDSSPSSPSSLDRHSPPKLKHRKDPSGSHGNSRPEPDRSLLEDPSGSHHPQNPRNLLEEQARSFFQLASVSDRRERHSRYNAHGNRASFHGHISPNNYKQSYISSNNYKLKLYKNVFCGSEIIDSMVASGLSPSREEALVLGNKLASELNLFSRANPPRSSNAASSTSSPSFHYQTKKAKANLLAAQTILLGVSECSETNPRNTITVADAGAASTEGCFVDDTNAFYHFGPGVLGILREIDRHTEDEKTPSFPNNTSIHTTDTFSEETSCGSDHGNRHKNTIKDNQNQQQHPDQEERHRNLSITPNAPGCSNGKIVLEDLFLVRHPEMGGVVRDSVVAAASTKAVQGGKGKSKTSKSGSSTKKKAKKSGNARQQQQPPVSTTPFPKSILKNGGSDSTSKNKKNKALYSKFTKTSGSARSSNKKTKASHKKKTAHKIKAGAKIKYVSDKERRIALIEKGLSIVHSDQQVVLYRDMLKELRNRLSRLYTGDHFEIVSLSSHSSPPCPSHHRHQKLQTAATKGKHISAAVDPPPLSDSANADVVAGDDDDDYDYDDGNDDDYDCERNEAFDNALESLDDIISSNADLLTEGDDNASVWTEFIMGTSEITAQANPNTKPKIKNTHTNSKPTKVAKSEAKATAKPGKSKKKASRSSSSTPKATKRSNKAPKNVRELAATVIDNEESAVKESQQEEKKKKRPASTGWQAPAPLESGGDSGKGTNKNKNGSKARCDRNEIDLSSWAIVNRDRETKEDKHGERTKNFSRLLLRLPPPFDCNGDSTVHDPPDDLSLLMEQQQEREFQSVQTRVTGDVAKDSTFCHLENRKETKSGPTSDSILADTNNCGVSIVESVRSEATKDSNELARLRLVSCRPKNFHKKNPQNRPAKESRIEEGEARCRDYQILTTNGTNGDEASSESSLPTPTPTFFDDVSACDASDDTSSGIMEAIEKDPFYQQAANFEGGINKPTTEKTSEEVNGSDSSLPTPNNAPTHSQTGSFVESYNDSYFHDSFDDFEEEEEYSDEGSYMELTVADEDEELPFEELEEEEVFIEEVIEDEDEEEEIIEEEEEIYDEITIVSASNRSHHLSPDSIGIRPTLSPRRKTAQFRSSCSLPPVPELGPEPEPEPEPQPKSPQRENSVYVEVHSMPEDDDMTQITMDCFLSSSYRSNRSLHIIPEDDYTINNGDYTNHNSYLFPLTKGQEAKAGGSAMVSPIRNRDSRAMNNGSKFVPSTPKKHYKNQFSVQQQLKQRTKYVPASSSASSPMGSRCNNTLPTETSQERIQEILWKDLQSSDVTVVWSALEELRIIVANESRSRAYLVRHGGVMVIIDTMAEQLEVEVVQFLCCNILEQLASVDFEIGLTIQELGGVSLIEQSMKKHASSHRVKQMGDAALRTMSPKP